MIIKAAIDLFRQKGYNATTISDIVARAGAGKGTFYQYFKGKQELFFECADHVFYDIGRDDPAIRDEEDGLKRLWNRGHSFFHNHLHMIDTLNLVRGAATDDSRFGRMLQKVMDNLIDPIEEDLLRARRQGYIHFNDIHALAYLLMGAVEYCYYYLQNHPDTDIDKTHARAWDMALHGLYTAKKVRKQRGKS